MGATIGTVNKRYISAVNFLDKREIFKQVLDVQHDDDLLDIMELTGRSVPTAMPEFTSFVADALFVNGDTTGESVTGSGTTTVIATTTTATSGYARVNDSVRFSNGKVGRITAISTASTKDQLTIKSVNTGENLTCVSGDTLVFFSNAQGEGSLSPSARRWSQTPYTNLIQIFKDKASITDIQMASQVETSWNGSSYYTYKAIADALMSFRAQISLGFLLERQSTTKFSDASPIASGTDTEGNPIQHQTGLDQYISTYGIIDTLTTPGTVVTADMTDLVNKIIAGKGDSRYWIWGSSASKMVYDLFLKNLGSSNVQPSMRYEMNGKQADFEVDGFTFGGIKFDWKVLGAFNHPVVQATDVAKCAYFVPQGKAKTRDGGNVDRIRVRTMKPGGKTQSQYEFGNDLYSEVLLGKYAPVPTGERSTLEAHFEAHMGLEVLGAQQFVKQTVLA